MDRPGRDPLDLMDDVGKTLNIRTVPLNWPIGDGSEFTGVFDRLSRDVVLWRREGQGGTEVAPERRRRSTTRASAPASETARTAGSPRASSCWRPQATRGATRSTSRATSRRSSSARR
jgi:peptide subunit release factor RF-3